MKIDELIVQLEAFSNWVYMLLGIAAAGLILLAIALIDDQEGKNE